MSYKSYIELAPKLTIYNIQKKCLCNMFMQHAVYATWLSSKLFLIPVHHLKHPLSLPFA